jgi:hypothetical protein
MCEAIECFAERRLAVGSAMVRVVAVHGVGRELLGSHALLTRLWFDPLTMALTATMLGFQPGTVTAQLHRSHTSLRKLEDALHSGGREVTRQVTTSGCWTGSSMPSVHESIAELAPSLSAPSTPRGEDAR